MHNEIKQFTIGIVILLLFAGIVAYFNTLSIGSAASIRVACVGDSITQGSGYPDQLQILLGSNYTVGNFGVSGSTAVLNSVKPYLNESEFQEAKDFDPDIVIIMLGTNDANLNITPDGQNFEADYIQLVNSFDGLEGNQLIFVVKSPPIFENDANYSNTFLASSVIPNIDKLAGDLNLPVIDVNSVFGQHAEYFYDGIHPKAEGATIIATTVYDAVSSYTKP